MIRWEFLRPDSVLVWRDKELRKRLAHYRAILDGVSLPYYILAKTFKADLSFERITQLDEGDLWRLHDELRGSFKESVRRYQEDLYKGTSIEISKYFPLDKLTGSEGVSLLDLKAYLAYLNLKGGCQLCERRCRAKRLEGQRGVCGVAETSRVSSYFEHLGEEAPLVPSGTVFFSGCNFVCVYCQNWDISRDSSSGVPVSSRDLADIFHQLELRGVRNINLVGGDPIPHIPVILEALRISEVKLPIVFNSNLYLTEEAMKLIVDVVDLFLPDFKYGDNSCAKRLSNVDNYWEIITRNLTLIAQEGREVIIRHLVLPNHLRCCSYPVLKWISQNLRATPNFPGPLVNVMGQYHPDYLVLRYPDNPKWRDISRRLTPEEYEEALEYAKELGLKTSPL